MSLTVFVGMELLLLTGLLERPVEIMPSMDGFGWYERANNCSFGIHKS